VAASDGGLRRGALPVFAGGGRRVAPNWGESE